ncbi:putative bifunctional diguanylate cyclase/phosphodiesterase [Nitrosococcus oceani]|uniref:putative bifunctional diguanylate cyclase/phosphodiesterase n=1 Tax=Nitrosococcus oceani TaxID=1229 RepID=UPI0004E90BAD|nr:bifunctional diguanylate cyclase/phosphodiesterase [Nitrosococcus oceani]KFI22891.1 diguanylate phosphodiesterase [Nitrosococcus oceani]
MKEQSKVTWIEWRGSHPSQMESGKAPDKNDQYGKNRVMLLVNSSGNRALLANHLRPYCQLVEPNDPSLKPESFDLAIVDMEGLRQWQKQLLDAKQREEPVFLPVVLILSRSELKRRFKTFWDLIDEFILSPIERREFTERVSMLLRTRQLALTQRSHLAYLVNHDRLTGLPNQTLFMEHLIDSVRDASILNKQVYVTVVHIPLARTMRSLGHYGLERVVANCSTRLNAVLRDEVLLARLTTEEWGLIHRPGETLSRVLEICRRIQLLADEPIPVRGEHIRLAPRIGVGIYPDDSSDANGTLECAMAALSEDKGPAPVFYSRRIQHEALRFIRTESKLYEALEKEEFELWFQPQVSFETEKPVGVEALVRWRLPNGELAPPGEFLPVAASTGQILRIDRWVLEKACATMNAWRDDNIGLQRVSVNVTVEDIDAPDFVEFIKRALDQYQLPPPSLELELTETTFFKSSPANLEKLNLLRSEGISVAVDDFGKGYSSLNYLHKLPITTLKIDKEFIENAINNPTSAAIVETIVWLAKKFKLETVAEGIETKAQVEFLRSLGVTTAQGFFYSRPIPEEELREWIKNYC